MTIWTLPGTLEWGNLDLPLLGILRNWEGREISTPAAFSLAVDDRAFWFVAHHSVAPSLHSQSTPGKFMPELWDADVAECFLAAPNGAPYLELNLSPNGAWWSQLFTSPRTPTTAENLPIPGVQTYSDLAVDGSWIAAMSIPLESLRALIPFGETCCGNVNFILNGNPRHFLSAARLPGKSPDFHQPKHFPSIVFATPPTP